MSKLIPTTLPASPRLDEFQSGRVVEFTDWKALNERMNYHFSRTGAVVGGQVFPPGAPFETTSVPYTVVNSSAVDSDNDLDDWQGFWKFQRLIRGSATAGPAFEMFAYIYGRNIEMRISLLRFDGGITPSTTAASTPFSWTTFTATGDSEWVGTAIEFSEAAASENGAGPDITDPNTWFIAYPEVRVSGAATGYLWQYGLRETKLTSGTKLPRGP